MAEHVEVEGGKYTIVIGDRGELHALRYGQPWQDLTGNKMVYCLATELAAARNAMPVGWEIFWNPDGSIGIRGPETRPGLIARTSDVVYPNQRDLYDLLSRLVNQVGGAKHA